MKKLVILAAFCVASISAWAGTPAATVALNNFDANGGNGVPVYYLNMSTLAAVGQNIFVEVMGGPDGTHLNPITDITGAAITIPMGAGGAGAGNFDAGAGLVPGVAPNATASFEIRAWKGTSGYDNATAKYQSTIWTQATGSWPGDPLVPVSGPTLAIPGTSMLINVPEPSTLALGLLGGLALLIRRRSK